MFKSIIGITSNVAIKIKKYSPEIKLVLGIIATGAAIGASVKATLDTADILDQNEEDKNVKLEIAKKYVPTAGLYIVGTGLVISSFVEMKARYVGMVALYNGLSAFFQGYRERVKARFGEETEREIYLAETTSSRNYIDEKGKPKTEEVKGIDIDGTSPYAVWFTDTLPDGTKNVQFDQNESFNLTFLKAREQIANDTLNRRGYLFLNEVLDGIGLPMTKAGSVVGWVKGNGDNIVDFNLYVNERESVKNYIRDYNMPTSSKLLDFNVDGVIWDKI